MVTRVFSIVGVLCLLGTSTIFVGCSSFAPCEGQFSQLSANPNGSPCEKLCHCNNQAYEGVCLEGRCRSRLRDACSIQGQIRGCKLLAPAEGTTCLDGTQPCHPDGLQERRWGDCKPLETIAKSEDTKELCLDRIDNDCDGKVDLEEDSCKEFCNRGDTRQCYTGKDGTVNVGRCGYGTQYCDASTNQWFATCESEVTPAAQETCNGVDDNCDGKVDEGLPDCLCRESQKGQKEPCFTGPSGRETFGICRSGRRECKEVGNGVFRWGKCEGEVLPKAKEECNGLDDNCDGLVDEGCPCSENLKRSCGHDIGECRQGEQRCELGRWSRTCYAQVSPRGEQCDNRDNDCNGYIDDRLQRGCKTACGVGFETCKAGVWEACSAPAVGTETCNDKDDDCDGVVDNGLTQACQTDCGPGVQQCVKGKWSACAAENPPAEICDGKDNDCDGLTDEGLTRECKSDCGPGVELCTKGEWSNCTPTRPPPEDCNDKDDDCDGQIDEGLFRTCKAECGNSIQLCEKGTWSDCSAPKPQNEVCNGVDDDCDGTIDDGLTRKCDETQCLTGNETCTNGQWSGCKKNVAQETCNGKDDDCNGQTDENLTKACDASKCLQGRNFCIGGSWDDQNGAPYGCVKVTSAEICDNKDNDCDGNVDGIQRPCLKGCNAGNETCTAGVWSGCPTPAAETCNNKDDDCNGQIDDGLRRACDASKCLQGVEQCIGGQWLGCISIKPAETCNNKDDNCDGQIDEGLTRPCDASKCLQGTETCAAGAWTGACTPMNPPPAEICDGKDNDCNGFIDEGFLPGCTSMLAGKPNTSGFADGLRLQARFSSPHGIIVDPSNNALIIADTDNHRIRKIQLTTGGGVSGVSTFAGPTTNVSTPSGFINGTGTSARFNAPYRILRESHQFNTAAISEIGNHAIRMLHLGTAAVSTLSGSGTAGNTNSTNPSLVQFNKPMGLFLPNNDYFLADSANHVIRQVGTGNSSIASGEARAYAGTGVAGFKDGALNAAQFNQPSVIIGGDGPTLILDTGNHCIRELTATVSTFAGACTTSGTADGDAATARFNGPTDIIHWDTFYIADAKNHCIRRLDTGPSGVTITTLAGVCGTSGYREGPMKQALFNNPTHLAAETVQNKVVLYVSDTGNHVIRRIILP